MSRLVTVTVRSLSLLLGLAGLATAQEPPPLEPPSLEAPRTGVSPPRQPEAGPKPVGAQPVAPTPPAANRPTPPKPENRPMLAVCRRLGFAQGRDPEDPGLVKVRLDLVGA